MGVQGGIGKAQHAYAAMPVAESGKYDGVKAAILRRYDIDEETYRQRFRLAAKKMPEETNRELATRLQDLFRKWTKGCDTMEKLAERMIMEQLLNTMPSSVRIWVSERKPKTSQEAGQLADDYQQARRRTQHGVNWNQPQEIKKEATTLKRCHTCNQVGHLAQDCPKGNKSVGKMLGKDRPWKTEGDFRCFNCNQKGHTSKNCPSSTWDQDSRWKQSCWCPSDCKAGLVEGQKAETSY